MLIHTLLRDFIIRAVLIDVQTFKKACSSSIESMSRIM